MANHRNSHGKPCEPDDPDRLIWYGTCNYWTDDWDLLSTAKPIPACPHCGTPGFEVTATVWFRGATNYEAQGFPGYRNFLNNHKEECFVHRPLGFMQTYQNSPERHGPRQG